MPGEIPMGSRKKKKVASGSWKNYGEVSGDGLCKRTEFALNPAKLSGSRRKKSLFTVTYDCLVSTTYYP